MKLTAIVLAAAATSPLQAHAQQAILTGQCLQLVIQGEDVTQGCRGTLINTVPSADRIGFHLLMTTGSMIGFVGSDRPNPTSDTDEIDVTHIQVNLGIEGVPPTAAPAQGMCRFANPNTGPVIVECQARSGGKDYIGIFRTDGQPPVIQ